MDKRTILFRLELKRAISSIPSMLIGMAIFIGVIIGLSVISFGIQKQFNNDPSSYRVAVVESEKNNYTGLVLQTLEEVSNGKTRLYLDEVDFDTALAGLNQGRYDIAFVVPDDFIEKMINGEDTKIDIRYGSAPATVISFVVTDMTKVATNYVELSERCFYSMREYLQNRNIVQGTEQDVALSLPFLNHLMQRSNIYYNKMLTPTDNIPFVTYYLCVGIILIFLLLGLQSSGFLSKHQLDLEKKLKASGVSATFQILARFGALLTCYSFLYLLISLGVLLFKPEYFIGTLCSYIVLLPICGLLIFVYELIENTANAILTLFVLIASMGFLSGFFFPLSMLPHSFLSLSKGLITRIMLEYAQNCMIHHFNVLQFLLILAHTLVLIIGTVCIRNYRFRR